MYDQSRAPRLSLTLFAFDAFSINVQRFDEESHPFHRFCTEWPLVRRKLETCLQVIVKVSSSLSGRRLGVTSSQAS